MDCAAPAGTAPAGTDARPLRAAPAGTAPAGTDARLLLRELAEMALFLYRGGASKVEISNYEYRGIHFTAVFPAGLLASAASGWRAAVPGPKAQPRHRKANVAASAPGQQEGGNAKTRRNAKRTTARREREAAAPTTPPRTRVFCPPAVEERSPPPMVFRVWVAAVSAARRSARRVSLRRALLVARVSKDFPSGS